MKVIGIGLPRTGNTSLAKFLSLNGLAVSQYGQIRQNAAMCDAMVDFPMQISFPWLMTVDTVLKAIITSRKSIEEFYESTVRFWTVILKNGIPAEISELHNVSVALYGKEIPTRADLIAAKQRIYEAAFSFIQSGRAIVLNLEDRFKAERVSEFLDIPYTGIEYPHEGKLWQQVQSISDLEEQKRISALTM